MQSNRSRDTKPELALRRQLHALGPRDRERARPIPEVRRTADIVLRPARVDVEVRGWFWHGCPEHYRAPSANSGYWADKVQQNRRRDTENGQRVRDEGWILISIWGHVDPSEASQRIAVIVRKRRQSIKVAPKGSSALVRCEPASLSICRLNALIKIL
jgi:DNA mismatch endonuclease (patch repair protein)